MKVALLLLAALLAAPLAAGAAHAQANAQVVSTDRGTLDIDFALEPDGVSAGEPAKMRIDFVNPGTERVQEHIDYEITVSADGGGAPVKAIPLTHTSSGSVSIPIEFESDGPHTVQMGVRGILFQPIPTETASLGLTIGGGAGAGEEADRAEEEEERPPSAGADAAPGSQGGGGGGCLVATAAYGTEMAVQVQQLREVRDGAAARTAAGASFVESFNAAYYSFSPAVADLERQVPALKEAVRAGIAPMLATLSILGAAEIDTDAEAVAYGLAVIMVNAAIYAGAPVAAVIGARRIAARGRAPGAGEA